MATSGLDGASQTELRHRYQPEMDPEWSESLPYGGKVYLARKKKPDPMYVRVFEAGLIIFTIAMVYYAFFYFDNLHFHIVHAYAHLGYAHAQHQVGQRYLHVMDCSLMETYPGLIAYEPGKGVEKHDDKAMEWFKKAADQGHAHASYNLAIGHLRGMNTGLKPGEAHTLIHHAASKGVEEAHKVLNTICTQGGCD